jgi:(p)ppGpp synthase/HD superfamily hydrolase
MTQNKIWSQDLYLNALRYAGEAHGGQKIPGSELSYIVHVSSVCMEIIAAVCAGETDYPDLAIQCALLHDVIEDTGKTYNEIKQIFGADVADGVLALTKNQNIKKESRMADSIGRIKLQPREIWMVKLADRITNLQPPPPHWTEEKIENYRTEADYILNHLGSASPLLKERLAKKIKTYPGADSSLHSKDFFSCI